ncbi:MAG: Na+/H+ antiporter NhaC [Gammaproteobacteria bacterium]|nr:Na+/H+ antiporter NhaC [Gammaproteobacteria bacterium]
MTDPHPDLIKTPTLLQALVPVGTLVVLLALSVYLFGADSSQGSNQIALLFAGGVGVVIAIRNGHRWQDMEQAIVQGIGTAMGAMLILLSVGALIGSWMLSGTVPTMIWLGLKLLDPRVFFAASCLICAVASVSIGSSWTVAGTLGVGLVGVAMGLGLSPAIAAGAVVSGAYFGDKMSPLSDTTNLAPAVAGTDIFTHIRHMVWTTTPSFLVALVIYTIIGFGNHGSGDAALVTQTMDTLDQAFNITLVALLPLLLVMFLAFRKFPAMPTILLGALLGWVMAIILQPDVVKGLVADSGVTGPMAYLKGTWSALANGYVSNTGDERVDALLSRGGMSSMLTTIWLIICALAFGAVLEHAGILSRLIGSVLTAAKSTGSLIMSVVFTCIGLNIVASDQYMAIVLPGKMYRAEFAKRGLAPENLSRAIEDAGTLTSPLVPWNTCGAFMAGTLGVATFAYLPFAFFNLINPLVSILYGFRDIKITKLDQGANIQ